MSHFFLSIQHFGLFKKLSAKLHPGQLIALGFTTVILIGAVILTLPMSSNSGQSASFLTALFTATSATCVTGLVVVDTFQQWNLFGQIIILLLIQIGGVSFMAVASLMWMMLGKKITFSNRLVMVEAYNLDEVSGVVRLSKLVIGGTLLIEAVGALLLSTVFIRDYGVAHGIYRSIFHSVSAFCNAGFDLMGIHGAYSGLTTYADNVVVNVTIMVLIVIGGLGFFVWDDILNKKKFRKLKLYTKIVVVTTIILIFGGAALFLLFESSNTKTLADMPEWQRVMAAIFQSITSRTAGFNTIDNSSMTSASKALTCVLMFIGGSSGSTAGGIKTASAAILFLAAFQLAFGRRNIVIAQRRIDYTAVLRALSLAILAGVAVILATILISIMDPLPIGRIFFECMSAFGTVGLSLGITPIISSASRVILILLMFFGRVGILTLMLAITSNQRYGKDILTYPRERMTIG